MRVLLKKWKTLDDEEIVATLTTYIKSNLLNISSSKQALLNSPTHPLSLVSALSYFPVVDHQLSSQVKANLRKISVIKEQDVQLVE